MYTKFIFFLLLMFTLLGNQAQAQQQHFVYIQSDNKQPFYVKLDSKVFSSTSSGYAIIPRISKSDIEMQIGFPKNEFPSQNLNLNVNGDAGYNLKDFGAGKWGLFNLQTMDIVYANEKGNGKSVAVSHPKTVVEDKEPTAVNVKVEEKGLVKTTPTADAISGKEQKVLEDLKPAEDMISTKEVISKTKEENGSRGYTAVYKIKGANMTEYVDVNIEAEITNPLKTAETNINDEELKKQSTDVSGTKNTNEKFLDIELPNPNAEATVNTRSDAMEAKKSASASDYTSKKLTFNSDCVSVATDNDFFDTRKAMVSKRTDEEMIEVASKILKKKCFRTAQIKGLGGIILQEDNRLLFFEKSYPFVTDPQNYQLLSTELNSLELKEKFNAIIK